MIILLSSSPNHFFFRKKKRIISVQCKFSTYTQSRASIPKLSLYGPFFLFFSLIFRISYALYSYLFQCNNELSFRRLLSENRLREVHNKMFTGLTNLKTLWVETFMSLHKTVFTAVYINMHISIYIRNVIFTGTCTGMP